jgi:transposase
VRGIFFVALSLSSASCMSTASGEALARYRYDDDAQTVMVPVSLEQQLTPGTLELAIPIRVQRCIETSIFASRYKNDDTGCPAYAPKVLLKVV